MADSLKLYKWWTSKAKRFIVFENPEHVTKQLTVHMGNKQNP